MKREIKQNQLTLTLKDSFRNSPKDVNSLRQNWSKHRQSVLYTDNRQSKLHITELTHHESRSTMCGDCCLQPNPTVDASNRFSAADTLSMKNRTTIQRNILNDAKIVRHSSRIHIQRANSNISNSQADRRTHRDIGTCKVSLKGKRNVDLLDKRSRDDKQASLPLT